MAERFIHVPDFRYGLDSRRSELVAQLGTLKTLTNAHINQGGEIEKRKAFSPFADLAMLVGDAQALFGLETTELGLVTFGSALLFGTTPTLGQPVLPAALVGVVYQQLKHPEVSEGETYNADFHAYICRNCIKRALPCSETSHPCCIKKHYVHVANALHRKRTARADI